MYFANFVSKIIGKPIDDFVVMTNRQCVKVSTKIGKDLSDIYKQGAELTDEIIEKTINKYLPSIKPPNIISNEEGLINVAQKYKVDSEYAVERYNQILSSGAIAWQNSLLEAIFLPACNKDARYPEIIAHELEHFFNRKYTPGSIRVDTRAPRRAIQAAPKNNINVLNGNILKTLFEKFGVSQNQIEFIENIPSTDEGVKRAFRSKLYLGLDTDKRTDAYIRAIFRHYIHPSTGNSKILKILKRSYSDEVRAYEVSDNVKKYRCNINGMSHNKIRSSILKRLCNILDDEIILAEQYKNGKLRAKSIRHPGLPSDIYAG